MPCYHPLIRIEDYDGKVSILSKSDFDSDITDYFKFKEKNILGRNSSHWKRADTIPCGKCVGCRLDYSRQWANRIVLESKCYEKNKNWFITLTYNDENVPISNYVDTETGDIIHGLTLYKRDLQLFMKRLRKNYSKSLIRFYACGEYGSQGKRPHYHLCLFNFTFETEELKKHSINNQGDPIFTHEKIEEIWGKGFITIAPLNWETAAYTARYVMKKQYGKLAEDYYTSQGKIPEFVQMSLHPGIGRPYYDKFKEKIYELDEVTIPRKSGAIKSKPPEYFDKLLEAENPDLMEKVKRKRAKLNNQLELKKFVNTSLTPQDIREIEEAEHIRKATALIREI